MKYTPVTTLLLAGLAALLAGCAGPAQTAGLNDSAAPPDADVTEVQTGLSGEEAYRRAAQVLQDQDYALSQSDSDLRSLTTEYTGVSQRWGTDYVFAQVSASVRGEDQARVFLRGDWRTEGEDDSGQTIRKAGQNGSPQREAWKALHEAASALGDSLSYR